MEWDEMREERMLDEARDTTRPCTAEKTARKRRSECREPGAVEETKRNAKLCHHWLHELHERIFQRGTATMGSNDNSSLSKCRWRLGANGSLQANAP